MGASKFLRNFTKTSVKSSIYSPLNKTSSNYLRSSLLTPLKPINTDSWFYSYPHFNCFAFRKTTIFHFQRSIHDRAPLKTDNHQKPYAETTHIAKEAERIVKIVSNINNPKSLESALNSANLNGTSPTLVLEVLKKLNNAGIIALTFFRWAEKQKGFQHIPECYNSLIEALGKIKQFKMVWILVDEMKRNGALSKYTFALVCRRYARARKVKEAIDAFERMEKKYVLKPELEDYNWLLDTLSKSRHVASAQELFDKWKNRKFRPGIKLYTILLEGWGQECNLLRLNEVYREMRGDGFEPDVVTYGILINAYCKARRYNEAVEMYNEMERKNIKATPHVYCTLINGLGSEKRLNESVKFFELCKASSCAMEAPTYNAMIGAYCW